MRKTLIPSVGEDVEQLKFNYVTGGNVNGITTLENNQFIKN